MSKNTTFVQWAQEMCHTNTVIEYLIYRRPGLYTPYELEEVPKFGDDDYCIDYVRLSEIRMSMRYGHQLLDNPTYPRQDEEMEE